MKKEKSHDLCWCFVYIAYPIMLIINLTQKGMRQQTPRIQPNFLTFWQQCKYSERTEHMDEQFLLIFSYKDVFGNHGNCCESRQTTDVFRHKRSKLPTLQCHLSKAVGSECLETKHRFTVKYFFWQGHSMTCTCERNKKQEVYHKASEGKGTENFFF